MKIIKKNFLELWNSNLDLPPAIRNYLKRLNSVFFFIVILYIFSLIGIGFSLTILGATLAMLCLLTVKYLHEKASVERCCVMYKGKVKKFETKWYVNGFMEKYVKRNLVMTIETDDNKIVKCALGKYQRASFIVDTEVIIFSAHEHKDENGSIFIDGYYAISTDRDDFEYIGRTMS